MHCQTALSDRIILRRDQPAQGTNDAGLNYRRACLYGEIGAFMGTSSTTAYIESASGVQAGGRTGLTAVAVAVLFLACLFIAPLAGAVPAYATAPALFFVSCLMLRELADIKWEDSTESIPAVVTALMMPFTYSITNGVAFGFISYAGLTLSTGRAKEVPLIVWIIAAIFVFRYVYLGTE